MCFGEGCGDGEVGERSLSLATDRAERILTLMKSQMCIRDSAAAEKAEIPDLKGDMSVSGRVACDGVTAQAEFTRSAGAVSYTHLEQARRGSLCRRRNQ